MVSAGLCEGIEIIGIESNGLIVVDAVVIGEQQLRSDGPKRAKGAVEGSTRFIHAAFIDGFFTPIPSPMSVKLSHHAGFMESSGYNHGNEFSERIGFHFLHDPPAVFLDGANRYS
jgi:hypothetical protein